MNILHNFQDYFVHRYADQVVIGNDVLVGENNKMTPAKVINISNVKAQGNYYQFLNVFEIVFTISKLKCILQKRFYKKLFEHFIGAYVPLTKEGNIVVDGVLASCYASFEHDLAHIVMKPVQWFPKIMKWLFGKDNGCSDYADIAKYLGRMVLPHGSTF